MAALRPRLGLAEPARIRRHGIAGRFPGPADLLPPMVRRLPAVAFPRRAVSVKRRRRPLRRQPGGRLPIYAAAGHRGSPAPQRHVARAPLRSRDRDPHRPVRNGLPYAVLRARTHRHERRAPAHPRHVRREGSGRRLLRLELPARPPHAGTRRPFRATLPPRLGSPWQHRQADAEIRAPHRPGLSRFGEGFETTRDARGHARDLGWRVRPHAHGSGHRPGSPHQGLLRLDGRRRHQGWPRSRSHR